MNLKANALDEMLELLFSNKYLVIFNKTIPHQRQRISSPCHQIWFKLPNA